MVALVSAETVLLVLLLVLVAGLLRSHAEILRRLGAPADGAAGVSGPADGAAGVSGPAAGAAGVSGPADGAAGVSGPAAGAAGVSGPADGAAGVSEPAAGAAGVSEPAAGAAGVPGPPGARRGPRAVRAAPIAGATPRGDAVSLDFRGGAAAPTLLAFLTSGCGSCEGFWETLGERRLPPEVQTVIVTRSQDRESRARLRALSPAEVPVVMSSQAWEDYRVPGSPYFVLVDRGIRGEGAAANWQALASLVTDAIDDQRAAGAGGGNARGRRIDETFAAAGITPGHPSLYPGRLPAEREP